MHQGWYNKTAEAVAKELAVDISVGLSMEQADNRIQKYGYNELKDKKKETFLEKIIDQLKDFLVLILIAASIVSLFLGEIIDSLMIIVIVVINAVLGIIQEGKAEKALEALKKMAAPNVKVFRDGKIEIIPSRTLSPG